MNILHILEEKGKEDLPMRKTNQSGEVPPMMKGDIEEKEVTPEALRTEETTMGVASLGGEGPPGGSQSAGVSFCRRLFSPET